MGLFEADLPDGWHWQPLERHYRITKKPRRLNPVAYETIPFVPMDAVPAGGDSTFRCDWRPPAAITSGTYFERGDVLLSKITPSFENGKQGKADDLDGPFGYGSTELIPIQPVDQASSWYLFYYLLHPEVRAALVAKMEGSTGRQRVPEGAVRELLIPMPEPSEQACIAGALRTVQNGIAVEVKTIEVLRELKQAAMAELFTRGLRGEPQRESEIGPIPQSWSAVPLGTCLTRAQYGLSMKGQRTGNYPILRMNCQVDGRVVLRDLQYVDLDDQTFRTFRLEPGDLLFNRTNSFELVGRMAIHSHDVDAVFASYLIRLTLDQSAFVPEFVNYYFNQQSVQTDLRRLASRGVSQANINATKLKGYAVPKPSTLDEQREIVDILAAIDRKLDVHERRRALLAELFETLLDDLMTGRRRVADVRAVTGTAAS